MKDYKIYLNNGYVLNFNGTYTVSTDKIVYFCNRDKGKRLLIPIYSISYIEEL